jgi:class 3 adenylate cyclase/tetratricopeptide (TPR) repeat protein
MRCAKCSAENAAAAKFCIECGESLKGRCPRCGIANPPAARFCQECGASLGASAVSAKPKPPAADSASPITIGAEHSADEIPAGERKTVTALFADIKGSMELIEDLDPEEARAIVDPALMLMMEAVHRFGGFVAQSTGDGIFALFGAPLTHEDHPQRALYAALRMQEEIRRYSDRLRTEGRQPLQARVGVNTGEVVMRSVSTGEHAEYVPVGHATSLAARMQVLAPIGSIAITATTQRLVEGYFALKALGPTKVKGVSEPINVYEVTGLGPLRTRLQRSVGRGLSKFVGRQAEIDSLKRAAEQAKVGHGQIVAAMAEAGVGKSRLFYEFKVTTQSGWMVLEAFSVSHGKASAYLPVIDLLHGYFEIKSEDDRRKRREKVTGRVLALDRSLEDTLPYLFGLLGLVEGEDPLAQMDGQVKKRRTLDAIKRILLRESLNQPLIVMFEDLHWIDEETQALLNLLADSIGTSRLLLLVNYRPEYSHQWGSKTYYTQLRLDPLGRESADEMLTALLGGTAPSPSPSPATERARGQTDAVDRPLATSPAPATASQGASRERSSGDNEVAGRVRVLETDNLSSLKRLIIERTEGNPFFMEETVLVLLDEGALVRNGTVKLTKPLGELKIPPTVQAILASRIDRLPSDEKELLQTLAVIGKEFPLRLIKEVLHPHPPDAASGLSRKGAGEASEQLERMLGALQLGEFIYEQPAFPDVEYTFKHALTQEVAANSILIEKRKLLHERTAQAIESLFADRLDDHVDELAHHYERSANTQKAVEYLRLAGHRAAQRSASADAIARFSLALELVKTLPGDTRHEELALLMGQGRCMLGAKGYAAPEVEQAYTRALALARVVGDQVELCLALFGVGTVKLFRDDFEAGRRLGEEALRMAESIGRPALLLTAHHLFAQTAYRLGELSRARDHYERAIAVPTAGALPPFGKIVAMSGLADLLLDTGFPDQALRVGSEALALARRARPFALAVAIEYAGRLRISVGEAQAGLKLSDELIALSRDRGFPQELAFGIVNRGRALLGLGRHEEAIAQLNEGIAANRATGTVHAFSPTFAALARSLGGAGRPEEGLAVVEEGLTYARNTRQPIPEAEALSAKGELLLMKSPPDIPASESCFREAIAVARRLSARWSELRATANLARLLDRQGKREEARAMLAEIYGWFTEGFDTADLKNAKALLSELSA